MTETDQIIAWKGEAQLLSWGDTSTRGRTITLQLAPDDTGDAHPFATARTKSGKTTGQRYMLVMVEIGDDERPVERTPSQIAFLLCKDEAFWHFLNERAFDNIDSEEKARAYILEGCGIKSRSELDRNRQAFDYWTTQFYIPWQQHIEARDKRVLS
jgi:hypothetical protein